MRLSSKFVVSNVHEALWVLMGKASITGDAPISSGNEGMLCDLPVHQPPPVISVPDSRTPLYALTIGIDSYASQRVPNLLGAKADADAITDYLRGQLHVPDSQIKKLRDKTATRAAIIDAFTALKTDDDIHEGDPIFIYYAGHGTTAPAPEGWEAGGTGSEIQLLVPYDCHTKVKGRPVQAIPDRTIGVLLQQLADAKGDNITVVFDCCHSGSGTRTDVFDPTRLARGFRLEEPVPKDTDEEILKAGKAGRGAIIPSGFVHAGLRSHVLLAACGAEEVALEEQGRGIFTRALLDALSVVGADRITYTDLMSRLSDLPRQNPQCEGANVGRILYNSRAPSQGRVLYRVQVEDGIYTMEAGAAHGITEKSEFVIYASRDTNSKDVPLGRLEAGSIHPFSTEMVIPQGVTPFDIRQYAFALQTRVGAEEALRLHVALDDRLASVFEALAVEMRERIPGQRAILFVDKDKADLDIVLEGGNIVFRLLDTLTTPLGLSRMYQPVRPHVDDILPVLRGAAHFYWHLRRTPEKSIIRSRVQVEFTKLVETDEIDDFLEPICVPEGPNLVDEHGRIDLEADNKTRYGVKVVNNSKVSLYASLFYFDSSDLSITSYYEQPTGARPDPSLRPGGTLTIGYGSGGAVPYIYYLREDQDLDVGFLKLFLSTEPLDLSSIPQASPFPGSRGGMAQKSKARPIWDALMIAVVQHRPGRMASIGISPNTLSSPVNEDHFLPQAPLETVSPSQALHAESTSPLPVSIPSNPSPYPSSPTWHSYGANTLPTSPEPLAPFSLPGYGAKDQAFTPTAHVSFGDEATNAKGEGL